MKKLAFTAVFFAVVALDLLDQNRAPAALFFAVVSTVIVLILIFSKQKQNQTK